MSSGYREQRGELAIAEAFAQAREEHRCALITYLTLGYPTSEDSISLVLALEAGGADIIELGVPFSDPVADGPSIQRASQTALMNGITPSGCFDLVAELRRSGLRVPVILMGSYNPIYRYGVVEYAQTCVEAGVDGLIVPDLPPEESSSLSDACEAQGLALIYLVAPTTSAERMAVVAKETSGFLYVVSRLGATGVGHAPDQDVSAHLRQAREAASCPIAVGFGISKPEHIVPLRGMADGIIVGSAIVRAAEKGAEAVRDLAMSLRQATLRDRAE